MSKSSVTDSPEIVEPPPPEYWYRYVGEMTVDTYTLGLRWQPGQVHRTDQPIVNGSFIAVEPNAPDMAPDEVLPPPPDEILLMADDPAPAPESGLPAHEGNPPAEPPEPFSVPMTDPSA